MAKKKTTKKAPAKSPAKKTSTKKRPAKKAKRSSRVESASEPETVLVGANAASEALDVSAAFLRKWAKRGEMPSDLERVGGKLHFRYDVEKCRAWITANRPDVWATREHPPERLKPRGVVDDGAGRSEKSSGVATSERVREMLDEGDPARLATLGKPAIDALHESHKMLKTRQQLGALAGELLSVDEVRVQLAALCGAVRRSYERLPGLVASAVCARVGDTSEHALIAQDAAAVCRVELEGLQAEFGRMVAEVVREQRRAMGDEETAVSDGAAA